MGSRCPTSPASRPRRRARRFRLAGKGSLEPGADADLTLVDLAVEARLAEVGAALAPRLEPLRRAAPCGAASCARSYEARLSASMALWSPYPVAGSCARPWERRRRRGRRTQSGRSREGGAKGATCQRFGVQADGAGGRRGSLRCSALSSAVALVLAGGTSAKPQATPFKAAWIYVGPHNDAGWSQAHDMGRLYVQKKLGANVKTTFKENIANGPQLEQTVAASSATATRSSSGRRSASSRRSSRRSTRTCSSSRRPEPIRRRTWPSTSARVRTRSTSPAWPPARRRRTARSATSSRSRSPR